MTITLSCRTPCDGEVQATNKTSLLMGYAETEHHLAVLSSREVSETTHTVVYCPECRATLYREIEGGVRPRTAEDGVTA
jgi:hypothetical protein